MLPKEPSRTRIVTAAALFDGHDAAINIMRRIMQSKGAEIIHLGHNRSAREIVECAIEEDAHGIAITSYQGGHIEFFKYLKDLLDEAHCGHIKIFGGGGGTILPDEITELETYGIARIYSPDDGRRLGLEGMIDDVLQRCKTYKPGEDAFENAPSSWNGTPPLGEWKDIRRIARAITHSEEGIKVNTASPVNAVKPPVVGITGTGGSGKSSVTDEVLRRFLRASETITIAIICVDPSKKKSGGALLGDRIRMNAVSDPRVYMRSLATREDNTALSNHISEALEVCRDASFDLIILESAGTGQSDTSILDYCDVSLYVMTPEYGAASQLEKINMLDYADLIALNKSDKPGAADAYLDVVKQYKRSHGLWSPEQHEVPVFGTVASQFNDGGVDQLFLALVHLLKTKSSFDARSLRNERLPAPQKATNLIPSKRVRYLSEIAESNREYDRWVARQAQLASDLYKLRGAQQLLPDLGSAIQQGIDKLALDPECKKLLDEWPAMRQQYAVDYFEYEVRGQLIRRALTTTTLSGTHIRKVLLPQYSDWGDILRWQLQENLPGKFPFTAGVFELRRAGEDPTRMFAGEGSPERTNRRFHYLSRSQPAIRLSTAFDSVTLYGEDPHERPDIFGKVGNAGVSIATVNDAKKLYSGFDLCDPKTSVSMTINGPAPVMLAFFLNAAIDQRCEKYLTQHHLWPHAREVAEKKSGKNAPPAYHGEHPVADDANGAPLGLGLLGLSGDEVLDPDIYQMLKREALSQVRGTVQADILKEDQAQNTCIFSTEFALKMMGDVQEYFIAENVRNFYSISISGYHIAEAGANPITQLAFTLANGFTYLEYFLSRGMKVDDFAPNLSFFFSNGMDPEYSVIGRVARKIWAKSVRNLYKGNDRSQKLKYHIQTSGRSLHAQEIDFNDIRTTLQALYAIYDNCNSLHTNAYDEAITTPTEESVRRALAIQLIINRELGTTKNENPLQGAFLIEELTALVEEAVLAEFDRISDRGGVLGAMERMYQRNRIQEESLLYEHRKHTGELPVVGVNTFLNSAGSPTITPDAVIRSTDEEKTRQIENLRAFQQLHRERSGAALATLQQVAIANGNVFQELMETVKSCSLGQITHALYEVGGQYRRNM